jgi:hypothetical protein
MHRRIVCPNRQIDRGQTGGKPGANRRTDDLGKRQEMRSLRCQASPVQ